MSYERTRRPGGGGPGAPGGQRMGTPGKRTLTDRLVQRNPRGAASLSGATSGAGYGDRPGLVDAVEALPGSGDGGDALPHKEQMEASFGVNFSSVRAQTGVTQLRDGGARAATQGERIAFAESDPSPMLVAHELTHVVQQRNAGTVAPASKSISWSSDPSEVEADAVASAVASGRPASSIAIQAIPSATLQLSREDEDGHAPTLDEVAEASARGTPNTATAQDEENLDADFAQAAARLVDEGANVEDQVRIVYKGKRQSPGVMIVDPDEIPHSGALLSQLDALRSVEPALAVAAARSVADRPEMLAVSPMFQRKGGPTEIELPAQYQAEPPTAEIEMLIAVNEAQGVIEWLVEQKLRAQDRAADRHYADGMVETREQHEARITAELAEQVLSGLTGTFGGAIGYLVSSLLTDDREQDRGSDGVRRRRHRCHRRRAGRRAQAGSREHASWAAAAGWLEAEGEVRAGQDRRAEETGQPARLEGRVDRHGPCRSAAHGRRSVHRRTHRVPRRDEPRADRACDPRGISERKEIGDTGRSRSSARHL